MAAALGLPEEDLELSMGMSADYEQAVWTLTLALPACHPAAHLRIVCLSMGMSADFELAHLFTCLSWSLLSLGSLPWWCWGVQHSQSYSGGLFVSTNCMFLQRHKISNLRCRYSVLNLSSSC